jgi:hypothetical protein
MAFTNEQREAFLALLHNVGDGAPHAETDAFIRDNWHACIEEMGAIPGFDQLRAGLIRRIGPLLDTADREPAEATARSAIDAYIPALADADPLFLLARHPAWVALASLELDRWRSVSTSAALDRAVVLATAGFAAVGDGQATGRGEVLWALAEQAEDAGWDETAIGLYAAAVEAPFTTEEGRSQVQLLLALRWVEEKDSRGPPLLATIAEDGLADPRTRVHAGWVAAAISTDDGDSVEARRFLVAAREEVDEDEEPAIASQLDKAIAQLG